MTARWARLGVAILGTAVATWLVLSLLLYGLFYRTLTDVYEKHGRNVMQVVCGRSVPDALVYTLAPGICRFANAEFDTGVTADADGFRNVEEHLGTGPVKVALLGDSHALGWGVEQGEKLSTLLARDPRLRVRDLAGPSYGTPRELLALRRFGGDADIVVLQYCENDRFENAEFLRDPKAFFAEAPKRAQAYWAEVERHRTGAERGQFLQTALQRGLAGLTVTWRMLRLPTRAKPQTPPRVIAEEARLFAGVLLHFKAELAGKTVLVFDSFPRGPRPGFAPAFRAALADAGLNHIAVMDLAGTLQPSDYFHLDDHMRPSGHAKVAARVLVELGKKVR